jgi:hypothetical protein
MNEEAKEAIEGIKTFRVYLKAMITSAESSLLRDVKKGNDVTSIKERVLTLEQILKMLENTVPNLNKFCK